MTHITRSKQATKQHTQAYMLKFMLVCCKPAIQAECQEIANWSIEKLFYDDEELLMHEKIWDMLKFDKEGQRKEHHLFDKWCMRIAGHRTESVAANSAATEHANDEDPFTEHANDDVPFRKLAEDIFAHDLTAKQRREPKYHLREGKSITNPQRSFINNILRKNLGDPRIAYYIFEHGIPTLMHANVQRQALKDALKDHEGVLYELMIWYASLLKWLVKRKKDPSTIIAQKLSDPDQKPWQDERRRKKTQAQEQIRHGKYLVELRESERKRFNEMSATEQRDLEDFECGRRDGICVFDRF